MPVAPRTLASLARANQKARQNPTNLARAVVSETRLGGGCSLIGRVKVSIDNTVVNIASRELKKGTVHQELNECVKRFVDLKHFLETCASLLKRVNRDPLDDSLKKYVDA